MTRNEVQVIKIRARRLSKAFRQVRILVEEVGAVWSTEENETVDRVHREQGERVLQAGCRQV